MKRFSLIGFLLLLALAACDTTTREARRMVKRAEQLADTLPDSTVRLIDSVLRMPASFSERERMDMALLQAEALFGDHGRDISPVMNDDFFDDHDNFSTSPELEHAAAYYAKKKQYGKAAHAALYSGFVQQHYDEKENAMRSFKEAEQYGELAIDSLTVAQAEYWMGKMLYYEGRKQEALSSLIIAKSFAGNRSAEQAFIENSKAVSYILMSQYDSAELCLRQSFLYAEKEKLDRIKLKIYNNYSVLYRLQGKYGQAVASLQQMMQDSSLNNPEQLVLFLNLGNTYFMAKEIDSAAKYYQRMETILPIANVKKETVFSIYEALLHFAESQNNTALALHYREKHEMSLYDVMIHRQEQTIYRIQQQYNYESLQNDMNKKLIQRQHIITLFGIVAIIGLAALAVSQIRLAKTRKQEAEIKANLFHFMQQNKELAQKHESSEKALADLSMMHKADEKAYQDLIQKNSEIESACNSYAQQLSDALNKEALTMRKLDIFLKNREEKAYLAALKDAVFNDEDPWDALMGIFDLLYPNVRTNLTMQHPELTEMEQKDFILSYFNVSRDEEARLFQKSVHYVDKLRYTVRQKMKQSVTEPAPESIEQA